MRHYFGGVPAILPLVPEPYSRRNDEEHDQAPYLDVCRFSQDRLDSSPEIIPRGADHDRPDNAADGLINKELNDRNPGDSDDHGGGDPQPVQPLRDENGRRTVALEHPDASSEMMTHARKAVQETDALRASQPEPEDVAAIGAQEREKHHQSELQVAALGEKAGRHQDCLPLEKGPDEDGEVAEFLQQQLRGHG